MESTAMEQEMVEARPDSTQQTLKELLAGSFGGITQVLTGQPFDTVKVRLQTQPSPPIYSGVGDCVKKIISQEGFAGFYKGTLTPLVGVGACVSIQFGALEYMKRYFQSRNSDPKQSLSLSQLFLSGAASGIANSVLSGPIEHVRTRLQVQSGPVKAYNGPWDFIKKAYAQNGIAGIYKGQGITLMREFWGYGIYFATYEALMQRTMEKEYKKRNEIEAWKQITFGACSGYLLWIFIYPIDNIKSRIQTDGLTQGTRKYASSLDCLRQTIAKERVSGLYKGFVPCMLRAGPVNAATFVAYEIAMNFLGR